MYDRHAKSASSEHCLTMRKECQYTICEIGQKDYSLNDFGSRRAVRGVNFFVSRLTEIGLQEVNWE